MIYKVTKKFQRGSESPVGSYKNLAEAKHVIQTKLKEDAAHKVEATYCLYEGFDLLEAFDQSAIEITSSKAEEGSSGSGSQKGSSQTFNPSPFSMTPTPKGMPPRTGSTDDDKDKE